MPTEETTASPSPPTAPKPAAFASSEVTVTFRELNLSPAVLRVLDDVGYESPSPIQAATIPRLLAGEDVVGQAQTGTGKTAAFALPILTRLNPKPTKPQALVLTPTRELAIQVAEAFQRYASHVPGFHVLPIYGGQSYVPQLSALRRGVHVVVGTPGRILDHLERGSLDLSGITTLVLDEADEMLRMGFIDDVETILKKTPPERQVALFSATMPAPIRRIAKEHLKSPVEVTIRGTTTNAPKIRQRYWLVSGLHKLDALTRILEVEPFEAMIVFARTKLSCAELAERLEARGFAAAPIHGDMQQAMREKTIARLRDGQLDILVATDVAARGLDVDRVSHVLNYDIPHDTEAYIHRIGRTGRAGRSGEAILFLTPRERHMLAAIERATRQTIQPMELPTVDAVNDQRIEKFKRQITETLENDGLELFQKLVEQYEQEHNVPAVEIAAALARMAHGDAPLLLEKPVHRPRVETPRPPRTEPYGSGAPARTEYPRAPVRGEKPGAPRPGPAGPVSSGFSGAPSGGAGGSREPSPGLASYRVEVGLVHGVKPGNLVGAITNEAGLESRHIGKIDIRDGYSLVELPVGLSSATLRHLQNVRVAGQRLAISRERDHPKRARPK